MDFEKFKAECEKALGWSLISSEISEEWRAGGYSGGNCWDNRVPLYESSDEPEPEFDSFDTILNYFNPDLKFIEYQKASSLLIKRDMRSVSEYYGNSTDYESKTVNLEELYNYLNKKGWLAK